MAITMGMEHYWCIVQHENQPDRIGFDGFSERQTSSPYLRTKGEAKFTEINQN